MDPLSITTGAVTLIGVCYKATIELKRLRNGASESRGVVSAMLGDMIALRSVLQSIEESFDDLDSGPELTGTLGKHWRDLQVSLREGFKRVTKLERLLVDVNRDVSLLDSTRRHLRLKEATDEIVRYRQEIQAYKDMLQLSLQSVTVFEQVTIRNNTTQILARSDDIRHNIDRLQNNLEVRFQTLEALFEKEGETAGMRGLNGMRSLNGMRTVVRSATAVISSASVYGEQAEEEVAQPLDIHSVASDDQGQAVINKTTADWIQSLNQASDLASENGTANELGPITAGQSLLLTRNGGQRARQSSQDLNRQSDRPTPTGHSRNSHENTMTHRKSDQDLPSTNATLTKTPGQNRSRSSSKPWTWRRYAREEHDPSAFLDIEPTSRPLKFCFVGDGACGKTCFLIRGTKGVMSEGYVPTVYETYCSTFKVDELEVELLIFDTAGQEDYDRLRPLCYPDTDVFCVCFAIHKPDSLSNVIEKWKPEVSRFGRGTAIVYLLGFQTDLRNDAKTIIDLCQVGEKPVSTAEGQTICKQIGAVQYLETSAKTGENVQDAFTTMIRYVLAQKPNLRKHIKREQRKGLRSIFPW